MLRSVFLHHARVCFQQVDPISIRIFQIHKGTSAGVAAEDLIESVIGSGTRVRRARMIVRFKDPDGNVLYVNL